VVVLTQQGTDLWARLPILIMNVRLHMHAVHRLGYKGTTRYYGVAAPEPDMTVALAL
jgi:hypothetical protein